MGDVFWHCIRRFYYGMSCQSHSQIQHYIMCTCHAKDPFFRNSLHTKRHQILRYALVQILLLVFVWPATESMLSSHNLLRCIIFANGIEKQGVLLLFKPHFDKKTFSVSQLKSVVHKTCKILQAAGGKLMLQHKRISSWRSNKL